MTGHDSSSSDDAEDSDTDTHSSNSKKSSIKLESHDLTVHINSTEDLEKMSMLADYHMKELQRAALVGEYEVLEESDALFDLLGGR